MSDQPNPIRARSNYRQLRITATHETNGRFSVSVYAKPLNKEWSEHHCMTRLNVPGTQHPLRSTEDVLAAAAYLLDELMLPGIDPPRR